MRIAIALIITLFFAGPIFSQDTDDEEAKRTKAIAEHWLGVSRDYAEAFTITPLEPDAKPYALHDKAVFHHTQSVRGDDIGAMHLWLQPDGRPAVIGVVFAWTNSKTTRICSYEFHSLTPQKLSLTHEGRAIWNSQAPGLEWKEFPDATPAPASRKLQQRLQVRRLARRFSANTTTPEKDRWELRFVPTPIYEYDSQAAGVSYGGVYVFCQGTDTEVILLIEAHNISESAERPEFEWRYAVAPFTDYQARVKFDKDEVWVSPPGQLNENGKPHYWSYLGPMPKPEVELE